MKYGVHLMIIKLKLNSYYTFKITSTMPMNEYVVATSGSQYEKLNSCYLVNDYRLLIKTFFAKKNLYLQAYKPYINVHPHQDNLLSFPPKRRRNPEKPILHTYAKSSTLLRFC